MTRKGAGTGAAWLSSARVVRCMVKSYNERNPCPVLPLPQGKHSQETASVNGEEGGDDVKSSWPLCPGLHTYYNGRYRARQDRKVEQIAESRPQFGLRAETRPHEVGIASNRVSAGRGEYVPGSCTHRPSHHGSNLYRKPMSRFPQGIGSRPWYGLWLGWSRNKVAVRECAAGSPPL